MDIMSLDWLAKEIGEQLPFIAGMGSSLVESTGFVLVNVKVPCVKGYDEDQVALVMDDPDGRVPGYPGHLHLVSGHGSHQGE